MAGLLLDPVADEYNAARPSYPDAIFDELEAYTGPLAGDGWFAAYQATMTATCPGYQWRSHSDGDWATEPIAATGLFEPGRFFVTRWIRTVRTGAWLTEERSKSYVAHLEPAVRDQLLAKIAEIIGRQFGDGQMSVPYLTRMWLARRRYSPAAR